MHVLQGSLLCLEQMIRFNFTSPLDVIQTFIEFTSLKAEHEFFRCQTILRLECMQAPGSAVQAQIEHLQFRADGGLDKWLKIDRNISGNDDLLAHSIAPVGVKIYSSCMVARLLDASQEGMDKGSRSYAPAL